MGTPLHSAAQTEPTCSQKADEPTDETSHGGYPSDVENIGDVCEAPEAPAHTPEELKKAICKQPLHKHLYRKVLLFLREEHTTEQAEEFIAQTPEFAYAIQPEARFLDVLERAGGIERKAQEGEEQGAEGAGAETSAADTAAADATETSAAGAADTAAADATDATAADITDANPLASDKSAQSDQPSGAAVPSANAGAAAATDAANAAEAATAADSAEAPTQDALDPIDTMQGATWLITELGEGYLEQSDPASQLHDLIAGDSERAQTYLAVLEACDEKPLSLSAVGAITTAFQATASTQPSVFVDKLERAGGLYWSKAWRTTEEGRACLKEFSQNQ